MITPFIPLTEISIDEIDRVICELEAMLEGRLDLSNIAVANGVQLPISTNSATDVDGYFRSMKFIAKEEDSAPLFSALDRLDTKLTTPYQLTGVETTVNWELNKDTRRSEGTKVDDTMLVRVRVKGSIFKPGKGKVREGSGRVGRARYNWKGKVTFTNWSSVEMGDAEKPRDLKILTHEEFFMLVWQHLPLPGITAMCNIFNVEKDTPVSCDSVEYTARHVPDIDSYMELKKTGETVDVESISNSYKYLIVYASSSTGEELAISMQVKSSYLLGAIL